MDLTTDRFTLHAAASEPTAAAVLAAVRKQGYKPTLVAADKAKEDAVRAVAAAKARTRTRAKPSQGAPAVLPAEVAVAVAKARATGKWVLLDFHASWCPPCKRMLKETWPNPLMARTMARLVFIKVDTDAQPGIAKAFGVRGLPDARLLDPKGEQRLQMRGFYSAAAARTAITAAMGR